jgi:hypothetical protein
MIPKKLAFALMGLALFLVAGGHWAVLQGVAWTNMVHDFSKTGTLCEAVNKTLDGHHPCPLCKKITQSKACEESLPMATKLTKKAEVFLSLSGCELPLPLCCQFTYGISQQDLMPEVVFAPPVPVPRSFVS